MRVCNWLRLLTRNRFRIHPARWPMAGAVTGFATWNSMMRFVQNLFYGTSVARTQIEQPPVFIIGHWRSGTTYLHELLTLDDHFTSPTTYECFAPNHFLISEWFVSRYMGFFVPNRRPQDDMAAGWDKPQEDEFALCNLGIPSPYLRMLFPKKPPVHEEYLDMEGLTEKELAQWKEGLMLFLRMVTHYRPGRMLLKSPPHTGRIGVLSDMFPGARFIHLVRNPYELFPSTVRLWKSLDTVQGLQLIGKMDQREYVFRSLCRMYDAFERARPGIDPAQICDVRYEDLVQDPIGQLSRLYEHLDLGNFSAVEPNLTEYVQAAKDFTPNRHELDEPTRDEITRRWARYIETYGY